MMNLPTKPNLFLIPLIIAGAIIRFWNIGFQQMNWDEEFTITFAGPALSALGVFLQALSQDFTPPLYYLAAHFSMVIFGATAEAIRYPSAIAGILLIPVMYFIGREYKDELYGLLLAGFTTVFYNFIFYSKFGRAYSIALLFFSLAFYYFMRLLKGDKPASIPFGIFALLALWTHLYAVIPLGVMILYLLWHQKVYWHAIAITIIGSLPLLNYSILILTSRPSSTQLFGEPPLAVILYTPLDLFAYSAFIIVPIIVYVLWKHREDELFRFISVMSVITWASMLVLSFVTPVILHYALWAVPALLLAFVLPFWEAIKKREIFFYHAAVVMVIVILELVQVVAIATIQRLG